VRMASMVYVMRGKAIMTIDGKYLGVGASRLKRDRGWLRRAGKQSGGLGGSRGI